MEPWNIISKSCKRIEKEKDHRRTSCRWRCNSEEDKKALEKAGVSGNFGPGTSLDIIIDHITNGVSKLRKL